MTHTVSSYDAGTRTPRQGCPNCVRLDRIEIALTLDEPPRLEPVPPLVRGLPEWIEPTFRFREGLDPIGLRALTAGRIVSRLTPGVLALSDRARYISFYAWLLKRYAEQHRPLSMTALGNYILAREYEYGLAVRLCPNGCGASPMGMRRIGPVVAQQPAEYARGESVESPQGGYGLYYRSPMLALELVRPPGTMLGDEAIQLDVLNRGFAPAVALAEAFEAAVADTAYVRLHLDHDGPIPADALIEYAARGCLCRLPDHLVERDLLRSAYLEPSTGQSEADVARRQEAFALFLDLIDRGAGPERGDDEFRWAIWAAFVEGPSGSPARDGALARWTALAAINFIQEGINRLWVAGGGALRQADRGGGLDWASLVTVATDLAAGDPLEMPGGTVTPAPDRDMREFAEEIARSAAAAGVVDTLAWSRTDRRAIAGAALILAVHAQLPDGDSVDPAWFDVATVNGDWQPGLLALSGRLRERLETGGTVGELMVWLLDHLVVQPHENNAYSKLPDFTFRWRWEAGRLRFYDHPIAWDALGDLRSSAMTRLLSDLGFLVETADGAAVSGDGRSFMGEVFVP